MKASFAVGLLLSGCVGAGGDGPRGGGGGGPDVDSGDTGDTGPDVEPEVVVTACSDGDYPTIQAALDGAPEGAVVEVCAEKFLEQVVVSGGTHTLRAEPGAVLDGAGNQALVVTSTAGPTTLTVEGLTITNGWSERGGGVWCESATLTLTDVDITDNGAQKGGGLASSGCILALTRVEISSNTAYGEGGGGLVEGGDLSVVQSRVALNVGANGGGLLVRGATGGVSDSVFEDNSGHVGAGIWFDGTFSLTHTILRRNVALYTGGGFALVEGSGAITRNVVYENRSDADGGGGFTQSHTGLVTDNDFHDNVSADDAGGLRMLYGAAVVERNTFVANIASSGDGGAMKVSHAGCEVRDNVFEANSASTGGAIEVDDDISYLVSNTFRGNQASGRGGAIHFNEPYYDMAIEDLLLEDNVAGDCGGAMAMDDDGLAESPEDRFTVTASHLVVRGNEADQGGALCSFHGGFVLTNSIVADNVSGGAGGAVYVEGADLTITNTVLAGNVGEAGTVALRMAGSAVITDSIVADNVGGVATAQGVFPVWRYNLHHDNGSPAFAGMADPTGENGNIEEDPLFVDAAGGDFHLGAGSPGVDAGDPERYDLDGSRVDIGAYGGMGGGW